MLSGVSWSDFSVVCRRLTVNYHYIFSGISLWIISVFFREFHGKFSRDFVLLPHFFFGVWRRIISIFHLAIHGEQFDILSDVLPGTSQSIILIFCRMSHGERQPHTLKSVTPCFPRQNNTKTSRPNMIVYIVSPENLLLCLKEKLWKAMF
jgi:hypothetical protein